MRTSRKAVDGKMVVSHMRKIPVSQQCLRIGKTEENTPTHVRIGISCEMEVPPEDLPDSVNCRYVRKKIRKSYSIDHWTFDFTKTWSGTTVAEVNKAYSEGGEPVREIEIEVLDPSTYFTLPHHDSMYMAVSLLLKICDLLPHPSPVINLC